MEVVAPLVTGKSRKSLFTSLDRRGEEPRTAAVSGVPCLSCLGGKEGKERIQEERDHCEESDLVRRTLKTRKGRRFWILAVISTLSRLISSEAVAFLSSSHGVGALVTYLISIMVA
ncbi:hypothetical protein GUJ93_ZPchr0011g27287 [Zizania palustris]|uniref:Uncharacterized protein n=1 Tax=Zizania palustris TaxID=103762 RepID=A0A8J5WHH3_ZIZPA|nr:hypothetical protein GUJ93_ZPchr0011g27287 [Zizania palustris]